MDYLLHEDVDYLKDIVKKDASMEVNMLPEADSFSHDNTNPCMFSMVRNELLFRKILQKYPDSVLAHILYSLALLFVFSLSIVGIGMYENVFINEALKPDMLHDIGFWTLFFGVIPFGSFISLRYYSRYPSVFCDLYKNEVIQRKEDKFADYLKSLDKLFNHSVTLITIAGISCIIFVEMILTFNIPPRKGAWLISLPCNIVSIPGVFLAMYLIVQFTLKVYMGCILITRFIKSEKTTVNVMLLHPDGCGGFGPFGKLTRTLNITAFLIALMIALGIYSNMKIYHVPLSHSLNMAMIVFFMIGTFLVIFSPLIAAHTKMLKAKDEFFGDLNDEFEKVNKELKNHFGGDLGRQKKLFNQLKLINDYYEIAKKYPVWPFNIKVIYGFLGSISPVIFIVIQVLIEKIFFAVK